MKLLKGFNRAASRVTAVLMIGVLLVSGYVLWSNDRTYRDAENVYNDLLQLKPTDADDGEKDLSASFDELRRINPDISAWLTVNGTKIDYPVVQGENNLYYMNRDVYKNTSLAGSIFLDSRNSPSFTDPYLLIYGHHMDQSLMFGDLDEYLDGEFFEQNRQAFLTTEQGKAEYQVLAVMDVIDSAREVFVPDFWGQDLTGLHDYIAEHAVHADDASMDAFAADPTQAQVVALVTCTSGQTGTRLVVFLYRHGSGTMPPDGPVDPPPGPDDPGTDPDNPGTGSPLWESPTLWLCVFIIAAAVTALLGVLYFRKPEKK